MPDANPALGVVLHAIGGLAAASFYIPYRGVKRWSWETYWIVGGLFSWILAPWAVCLAILPQTLEVLRDAGGSAIRWTFFFGVLWGVGGLTFGLTMRYLGIALGYAIALGLCAAFGTLIPPLFQGRMGEILTHRPGQVVVLGVVVCLAGIAVSGRAGVRKEGEVSDAVKRATVAEFSLGRGMAVAVACGVMSACMAFGFAAGKPIAEAALRRGAPSLWQNLPVLIVVMFGGFVTNLVWCVFLSRKNGSAGELWGRRPGSPPDTPPLLPNYLLCAVAGVTWYLQFFFYSMGTTRMGRYDFSSWTLHMASIIAFSTIWGLALHEWKGTSLRTRSLVAAGLILLVASTVVVGYGNYLARPGDDVGALRPVELRCDGMTDPLGVDEWPPSLSWQLRGEGRGLRQTAWQVLVSSSRDALARDAGEVWDSGRVESSEQLHVPYGGRALRSSEQVFWKVRVWDGAGGISPWSAPATWTMGVLEPAGWQARFITDPDLLRRVRRHLGYRSQETDDPQTVKWLQVDLGSPQPLERVRFHAVRHTVTEKLGFPPRFKVEVASRADFADAVRVADYTARDFSAWDVVIDVPVHDKTARYVRLTANRLRVFEGKACLAVSQVEAISGGRNVAVGARVAASDSFEDERWSAAAVTDGLGVPGANSRANDTLRLRRQFTVRPGLRRALANVCGLGHYEMTSNGTRVGTGLLTPGWTDYDKTGLYDTYDLTGLLRAGENAVGLLLGGGMYNVQEGRYVKFVSPFRPLTVIAQVRLEYEDGTVDVVGTDERWRVAPGPIVFSNVYGGEDYDARREDEGWDEAGFDDSRWTPAVPAGGPPRALKGASRASPPFRAYETLPPVKVSPLRPGVEVYDFGQNASMMPRLRVHGPAGSTVKMIPAELLKADGSVDRTSSSHGAVEASWSYTLAGRAEGESYFPRFFYHGARYLQVERRSSAGGRLPEIASLESVVVHSDSPAAGEFSCSSDLFNRIRTLVRWAQRSNLAHVITDCPHRERLGWLEQYHLNGPALRYETDLLRLYAKGFADMADAQSPNGLVPDIAPEYVVFEDGFRDSPEWGSAIVLAAWQHLVFTGDETPLRRNYDAMRRYVAYLARRADGDIVGHGLGDWYDIGPKPPGYSQLTPIALTATAIFYEDTVALSRIAARLGHDGDARRYAEAAARIRVAFNRRFFDEAASVYATGSQTAQAMPLVLGLAPEDHRAKVLDALVRDVRAHGNGTTAGDVGYRYVLRALADGGRSDVVFAMNHQADRPGYGYQLAHGATSLTEAWDANPRSSQNHFMLGQIIEWFYGDLAGLAPDPAGPGFGRVRVRPQPVPGITWARAAHASPRGRVAVSWRAESGTLSLEVELPPNASGEVWIPSADVASVRESGRPVGQDPDVRLLRREGERVVLEVGSGRYAFTAPLPASPAP